MTQADKLIKALEDTMRSAPSAELALCIKYMSLIAMLASRSLKSRVSLISDDAMMKRWFNMVIGDVQKLPKLARKYGTDKTTSRD